MRFIAAVTCALLAVSALADQMTTQAQTPSQPSSVTISLTRYDELQKSTENASATVIDTMSLAGTFRDHNLNITFIGRSVGKRERRLRLPRWPRIVARGGAPDSLAPRCARGCS